VINGEIDLISI